MRRETLSKEERGTRQWEATLLFIQAQLVLGPDAIIGDNVVIGGNVWITSPVASGTTITIAAPELKL